MAQSVVATRTTRARSPRKRKGPLGTVCSRGSDGDGSPPSPVAVSAAVANRSCKVSLMYRVSFKVLVRVRNQIRMDPSGCRSPLGANFVDTPLVVPIRGWLDGIRRLMCGD